MSGNATSAIIMSGNAASTIIMSGEAVSVSILSGNATSAIIMSVTTLVSSTPISIGPKTSISSAPSGTSFVSWLNCMSRDLVSLDSVDVPQAMTSTHNVSIAIRISVSNFLKHLNHEAYRASRSTTVSADQFTDYRDECCSDLERTFRNISNLGPVIKPMK